MTGLPTSYLAQKQNEKKSAGHKGVTDSANLNLKFKRGKPQGQSSASGASQADQSDSANRDPSSSGATDRDNFSQVSTMSSKTENFAMNDRQLAHDNQMLTNELIVNNQDLSKTKAELKQKTEGLKKSEKEKTEVKKMLESKENALEKLRKERDELWLIVNTDKYRNFKSVDEEKTKFEQKFTQVQQKLDEVSAQLQ